MLHHVEINVSDLEKSTAFWSWFLGELGYSPYQSWDKGRSYRLDKTYIVFVQTEDAHLAAGYHRKRTGLNHLAFHARDKKHVDKMTEELKKQDVKILYQDRHPRSGGKESYAVFFEDPDRIKVELTT